MDRAEDLACPECGAVDGLCTERFDECLAREFQDPRYGRVHNLTVATYMLQHSSRMSREGWLHERELLRAFIIEGKTADRVRREGRDALDSGKRDFRFKSPDGRPLIERSTWTRTILDVHLDDPQAYCEDVIAWASAALADAETVTLGSA